MKNILAIIPISLLILSSCAGKTPRTKWTDKTMRIAIDPESVDANNYVRIQQALVASGKWVVVDRSTAFKAIKAEQQRLHREEADRYEDREKFALWGRMLGVGGVVAAHTQCFTQKTFWTHTWFATCHQYLSIVDTNTGEVIATAEDEQEAPTTGDSFAPPWDEAVARLNAAYPEHFESKHLTPSLEGYRDLAAEEAKRQKEKQ